MTGSHPQESMSVSFLESIPADVLFGVFCKFLSVFDIQALSLVNRKYCALFSSERAWIPLKNAILAAYPTWSLHVFRPQAPIRETIKDYLMPVLTDEGIKRLCTITRDAAKDDHFALSYHAAKAILSTNFSLPLEDKCWFYSGRCSRTKTLRVIVFPGNRAGMWFNFGFYLTRPCAKQVKPLQDKLRYLLFFYRFILSTSRKQLFPGLHAASTHCICTRW